MAKTIDSHHGAPDDNGPSPSPAITAPPLEQDSADPLAGNDPHPTRTRSGRRPLHLVESAAGHLPPRIGNLDQRFAEAFVDLALLLQDDRVIDLDPLQVITAGVVGVIPGAEFAAVVVMAQPGRLEARAVQGALPPLLMELQNTTGQGPCLDAVTDTELVTIPALSEETRWPRFVPGAMKLGIGSMICTPLAAGNRVFGSLSLAAAQPHAFTPEAQQLAAIFAVHAAIALSGTRMREEMTDALISRDVIGQAKGILMERYQLTPDGAFAVLVRMSQNTNIKLRRVCEELCSTGNLPTGAGQRFTG